EYLVNKATNGKYLENKKELNYESVYHLYFIVQLNTQGNNTFRIEKNHVIEAFLYHETKDEQIIDVPLNSYLSLNKLLQPKGESYYTYSPAKYNCQDFVLRNLENNGL